MSFRTALFNFYPRSPCGERLQCGVVAGRLFQFLSTLSLRRATQHHPKTPNHPHNFYPRSPCGERPHPELYGIVRHTYFYPRSPCGERPGNAGIKAAVLRISIHALLAESDPAAQSIGRGADYFYPRSPCGERLAGAYNIGVSVGFLSTLSLRRATPGGKSTQHLLLISIHALLAESDALQRGQSVWIREFLSTLSLRRATIAPTHYGFGATFLSTLSLRRATVAPSAKFPSDGDFYPRSPCGERRKA